MVHLTANNDSYCRECRDGGNLVCCASCTNAFHVDCLSNDKRGDLSSQNWSCHICKSRDQRGLLGIIDESMEAELINTSNGVDSPSPQPGRRVTFKDSGEVPRRISKRRRKSAGPASKPGTKRMTISRGSLKEPVPRPRNSRLATVVFPPDENTTEQSRTGIEIQNSPNGSEQVTSFGPASLQPEQTPRIELPKISATEDLRSIKEKIEQFRSLLQAIENDQQNHASLLDSRRQAFFELEGNLIKLKERETAESTALNLLRADISMIVRKLEREQKDIKDLETGFKESSAKVQKFLNDTEIAARAATRTETAAVEAF